MTTVLNSADEKSLHRCKKFYWTELGDGTELSYRRRNKSQHKGTRANSTEAGEISACFQEFVRAGRVRLFSGVSCPNKVLLGHLGGSLGQLR